MQTGARHNIRKAQTFRLILKDFQDFAGASKRFHQFTVRNAEQSYARSLSTELRSRTNIRRNTRNLRNMLMIRFRCMELMVRSAKTFCHSTCVRVSVRIAFTGGSRDFLSQPLQSVWCSGTVLDSREPQLSGLRTRLATKAGYRLEQDSYRFQVDADAPGGYQSHAESWLANSRWLLCCAQGSRGRRRSLCPLAPLP